MRTASQLFWRGFILFFTGTFFTFLLSLLQAQRHLPLHIKSWSENIICFKWWLPVLCGSVSALIGLIYPLLEHKTSEQMKSQEWSHVLRCLAMFIGINEACTKVDFPSHLQLSISLAILSIGLWWYFDRTTIGFGLGLIIAILATLATHFLVYHKFFLYSEKEFLFVRSWLPCVVFSGGITVANIGKQLAVHDFPEYESKSHAE